MEKTLIIISIFIVWLLIMLLPTYAIVWIASKLGYTLSFWITYAVIVVLKMFFIK